MIAVNQELVAASYPAAAQGLWPREHPIAAGTVLYRFVDTTRCPPALAADGPWWFEYEHFQAIKHFALRYEHSLGYTARLFAAILYEWSEVNAFVRARASVPMMTWKGRGKQAVAGKDRPTSTQVPDSRDVNRTPKGLISERNPEHVSKMTPMQGANEVYQIYVPGLGPPHHKFRDYFDILDVQQITTG